VDENLKQIQEVMELVEDDILRLEQAFAVLTNTVVELAKRGGVPKEEMRDIIQKSLRLSRSEWVTTEFLKMLGYYDEN
jgi:hypothetical protein